MSTKSISVILVLVAVTVLIIAAFQSGMAVYYGSGLQFGPVYLDWYYLTHPDPTTAGWFPGREQY